MTADRQSWFLLGGLRGEDAPGTRTAGAGLQASVAFRRAQSARGRPLLLFVVPSCEAASVRAVAPAWC